MIRLVPILFWWLVISGSLSAQQQPTQLLPFCSTQQAMAVQQKSAVSGDIFKPIGNSTNPFQGITYIPIRPHILRRSDGTGDTSLDDLHQSMAAANSHYLLDGSGIQFYFCGTQPDYVDNDTYYNQYTYENEADLVRGHDVSNAINLYTTNSAYAYYPYDGIGSTRVFCPVQLLYENNTADYGNKYLPHELGHAFGLVHTFGENLLFGPNGEYTSTELVTRGVGANCATTGDYVCDTPADPVGKPGSRLLYVDTCTQYDTASTARDTNGELFSPSISNIMSYYYPCSNTFTPGQFQRMKAALDYRRTHKSYSLDCPPTAVAAPGNPTATILNGQVFLTWQDNADNEMGYFIERSASATAGFVPIGGVGPNRTTFTDVRPAPTTYYYRIRPSNATTQGISPVVSIVAQVCRPTHRYPCEGGSGLSQVSINGRVVSTNSGCSANGYSLFTQTVATVTAGQSFLITGLYLPRSPGNYYAPGDYKLRVWADLNRNGLYEIDLNEYLFQTDSDSETQFSGTIRLPVGVSAGPLPLRVMITSLYYSSKYPCGEYLTGETEDYLLNVLPQSADLTLTMQVSDRVPALGKPVSYSVTLLNQGPNDATAVGWLNRLPTGLRYTGGGAGVLNADTLVGANNLSLASGASATFVYQLTPTRVGTFLNAAQVIASIVPDPDSQPNSGTGDGQDDAASADIRTKENSSSFFVSPNPNQVPLPDIVSAQPLPDPNQADLSLQMVVSNRTPALGQLVSFSLTVANAGGLAASGIIVRDTLQSLRPLNLPLGTTEISSGPDYSVIESRMPTLAAGESAQLIFGAVSIAKGRFINAAQIRACNVPDPDSTPNNGYQNGEDDSTQVDIRVR